MTRSSIDQSAAFSAFNGSNALKESPRFHLVAYAFRAESLQIRPTEITFYLHTAHQWGPLHVSSNRVMQLADTRREAAVRLTDGSAIIPHIKLSVASIVYQLSKAETNTQRDRKGSFYFLFPGTKLLRFPIYVLVTLLLIVKAYQLACYI